MKKIVALLLAAIILCAFVGCSSKEASVEEQKEALANEETTEEDTSAEEPLTIAFCQIGNYNTWRIAETEWIEAACKERGYKLIYTDGQSDTAKQVSDVEDVIAQKPDYILLPPRETTGFETVLSMAADAGIPVLLIDRNTEGEYVTQVSADFVWEGEQCAVLLDDYFKGEEFNVVVIEGTPGADSGIKRYEGFKSYMEEHPNMKIIASQVGNFNRADAQEVMENLIQAYGNEIDAVFAHDDDSAIGAIQALKAAGYKPGEDVVVVGVGGYADALKAIKAGEMLGSVECSPYFDKAFEVIDILEAGGTVEKYIRNDGRIFTQENVTDELIAVAW